jgi:hypothetical protein
MKPLCQPLSKRELVEVLKWPFCVGEAEKLVLAELERKLTAEFTLGDFAVFGQFLQELVGAVRQAAAVPNAQ